MISTSPASRRSTQQHQLWEAAALQQRQGAEVVVALAQQVEGDEGHGPPLGDARDVARRHQVDALLQLAEAQRRARGVQRDNLPVQEHGRAPGGWRQRLERRDNLGELRRLVVAETQADRHLRPLRPASRRSARQMPSYFGS